VVKVPNYQKPNGRSWPKYEAQVALTSVFFGEITLFWRRKFLNFGFDNNYC